jgi:hypothetical protein
MTERMSSVEIEDVLSSIRRLVTQDLRPKPQAIDDKLLLTPALRVVPAADADERAPEPRAPADAPDSAGRSLSFEMTFADDADAPVDDDMHSADAAGPVVFHRHGAVHDLAGAVTSIGAEVPVEGYEPETGEAGPADAVPVPEWPDSSWEAPEVISAVDEAEVVAPSDGAPSWAPDDEERPGDPVAAEFVEAPFVDVVDDVGLDPGSDVAEAEALAALAADDDHVADPALTELDESVLREIVRDIIREELQGALGERITRNVRKLVRAEINRATTSRDLE